MDANGTLYHLLLGEGDWLRCTVDGLPLRDSTEDSTTDSRAPSDDAPPPGLMWNRERSEVTLRRLLFQFAAAPKDIPATLEMRRGAARDRYGNWYWLDETGRQVRVLSEGTRRVSNFWPADESGTAAACASDEVVGDFRPRDEASPAARLEFRGLVVTEDHYLVVGVVAPAGLIFFDLHAGGSPQQIVWPASVPFAPFDMTPAPGGGLFILDRANKRYWALDRHLNVITEGQRVRVLAEERVDDFQPRDGDDVRRTAARVFPEGVSLAAAVPVAARDPVAIEALPDATVLVLDRAPGADEDDDEDERRRKNFCRVFRYRAQAQAGRPASTSGMADVIVEKGAGEFALKGHDFAYVPAHENEAGAGMPERLYIVSENGNQTFAFSLSERAGDLDMEPLADYLPMRLFGGRALVRAGAQVFYDYGENWIPLVEQRRPRYAPAATLYTPLDETASVSATTGDADDDDEPPPHAFDGREPDCVWHRLMLDACIPPETEVIVASRAANDEAELALAEWQAEPRLYLRGGGSELPFAGVRAGERYGTWELLFQRARGRFLQLRIELRGNGRTTPRLRALRAYYPRFSYLERYLPAVYREDTPSASFLDRFLSNFEGLYTTIEDRIAAAQMLFDVRSAPPDALEWLADWFGAALNPAWDDERRRLFIKYAVRLFQMRGTIGGLQAALRLSLEDCPEDSIFDGRRSSPPSRTGHIRIVERFRTRRTPGVIFGDPTDPAAPRRVVESARWTPEQGGDALHARYRRMLRDALGDWRWERRPFPIRYPGGRRLPYWRQFALDTLGFVPASVDADRRQWQQFLCRRYGRVKRVNAAHGTRWRYLARVPLPRDITAGTKLAEDWREFAEEFAPRALSVYRRWWQDFLARRYRSVRALNEAYGTNWPSFELVSLPDQLPPDGPRLFDWYQFEAVVLPMRRSAHRFTVLLPLPAAASFDTEEQRRRLELADRIIRLEKPAHTVFDVKLYWALFRVGEARLGEDTLLDVGSRAPQLLPPMVVGRQYLAQSYLAPTYPQDVTDRQTLGFARLGG